MYPVCLSPLLYAHSVHAAHTHFSFVFHVHQYALGLTHTRNHKNRVSGVDEYSLRVGHSGALSDTLRMQMYSYYHSHFYILNLCGSVITPCCTTCQCNVYSPVSSHIVLHNT